MSDAMRCTLLGHVAVNSMVWRCAAGSIAATMLRMSFSNPMSSMRSASSRISTAHDPSVTMGPPPLPCMSIMSIMRPGVATMSSTPFCSAPACCHLGAPPYTATLRHPSALPNLVASPVICSASSRVGLMIRHTGVPCAACLRAAHVVSAGRRNPSVLPEPVLAMARMSRPSAARGQAAPCTALGSGKPCCMRRVMSALGKGAEANSRHTRLLLAASWMVTSCSLSQAALRLA
mmetsp:Transcript_4697/g.11859  ORF Transcript_4697/g.11859 Transcript_4697/m.11859 type:complete len:233 (-) Transcript_4697:422-1120(-)